jgi:hypothetical protein
MAENQPSPRRRFQFRLRTLMLGVTLLALLCGAVMWVARDFERLIRERDAALEKARDAHEQAIEIERRADEAIADLMVMAESERRLRAITTERPPPK